MNRKRIDYVCICVCLFVCIYDCLCLCVQVCVCVYVREYVVRLREYVLVSVCEHARECVCVLMFMHGIIGV